MKYINLHPRSSVNADLILERVLSKATQRILSKRKILTEQMSLELKRQLTLELPRIMFEPFKPHEEIDLKDTPLEAVKDILDNLYNPEEYTEIKESQKYYKSLREFYVYVEELSSNPKYKKTGSDRKEGFELAKKAFDVMMRKLKPSLVKAAKTLSTDTQGKPIDGKDITFISKEIDTIIREVGELLETDSYNTWDEEKEEYEEVQTKNTASTIKLKVNGWIRKVRRNYDIPGLYPAEENIKDKKPSVMSSDDRLEKSRELFLDAIDKSALPEEEKKRQQGLANGAKNLQDIISYATQLIKSMPAKKIATSGAFIPSKQEPIPLSYEDLPKRVFVRPVSEKFSKFLKTNFKVQDGVEIEDDDATDAAITALRELIETSPDFNIMTQENKEEAIDTLETRNFSSYEDVLDYGKALQKKLTSLSQAFKNLFKIDYQNYTYEDGYQIAVDAFTLIIDNSNMSDETKDTILDKLNEFCENDRSPGMVLAFVNFIFKQMEQLDTKGSEEDHLDPDRLFTILLTNPITAVKYPPTYDFSILLPELKAELKKQLIRLFNEPATTEDPLSQLSDDTKRDIFTMVKACTSLSHLDYVFDTIKGTVKNPLTQEEINTALQKTLIEKFKSLYKDHYGTSPEKAFTNTLLENSFKTLGSIPKFLEEKFSETSDIEPITEKKVFLETRQVVLDVLQKYKAQPGNLQGIDAFFRPIIKILYESAGSSTIITSEDEAHSAMKSIIRNTVTSFIKKQTKIDQSFIDPILDEVDNSVNLTSTMLAVKRMKLSLGEEVYSDLISNIKDKMVETIESYKNQSPIHFIQTNRTQRENVMFDIAIQAVKKSTSKKELIKIVANLPRYVSNTNLENSPAGIRDTLEKAMIDINENVIKLANQLAQSAKIHVFLNVDPKKSEAFESLIDIMEREFTKPRAVVGVVYTKFTAELYRTAVTRLFGLLRGQEYPEKFIEEFADDVSQADTFRKLDELITKTFISSFSKSSFFKANERQGFTLTGGEGIVKSLEEICVQVAKRIIISILGKNKSKGILQNQFEFLLHSMENLSDVQVVLDKLAGDGMTGGDYLLLSTGSTSGPGGLYDRAVELVKSSSMKKRSKVGMLKRLENYRSSSSKLLKYIYSVYLAGEGLSVNKPNLYR